jgi:formate-dependent nitrite reductase membrane component NrfD
MTEERQKTWDWMVTASIFLEGVGGATFLISFILGILYDPQPLARVGLFAGPVLCILGTLFLMAHLGVPTSFLRVFGNFATSWMSRGALIVTLTIIFGLIYAGLASSPWDETSAGVKAIGCIGGAASLMLLLYAGFLFTRAKSIPLWNNPALIVTGLFGALLSGSGLLLIIQAAIIQSTSGSATDLVNALRILSVGGIIFIVVQLISLWGYMDVESSSTATSVRSANKFSKTPLFILGVLVIGLIIPLILLIVGIFMNDKATLAVMSEVTGILLIIGGIALRQAVVSKGQYIPLYPL